jgi:ABC-type Mn2+/Zn2+ transport system permease subunit
MDMEIGIGTLLIVFVFGVAAGGTGVFLVMRKWGGRAKAAEDALRGTFDKGQA